MVKKIVVFVTAFSLAIVVAACGETKQDEPQRSYEDITTSSDELEKLVEESINNPQVEETTENSTQETVDLPEPDGEVIEINEKMYVTWVNEIYINPKSYLGKTIHIEGMYKPILNETENVTYHYVYRNGPGCCGTDGMCGFEIMYKGTMPTENDWIDVVGVLEEIEDGGETFLVLNVSSLTVKTERGSENVTQ
ncbi:MAG: hypothetical protein Q4G58_03395 [bacterium]|nr:hypothetical protein [bacterium]